MKKAALTLSVLCALNVFVFAGPEAFSGKEMKQVVPAPEPACFNWTGFYIGAFGGYKISNTDVDLDLGGLWDTIPDDRDFLESNGSTNLDPSGPEIGGVIGYNYQFRCWVFGLEASGAYLWADDSHDTGFIQFANFTPVRITTSFETRYLMTFAPRVGYAFGKWLPYVTGGLAVGDLHFFQELENPPAANFHQFGETSETRVGWMIGGGLQYAVTQHWSVRAQYQYIDLGSVDFNTAADTEPGATGRHEASLREHNTSLAVIYGF